jgi:hypothetical protein
MPVTLIKKMDLNSGFNNCLLFMKAMIMIPRNREATHPGEISPHEFWMNLQTAYDLTRHRPDSKKEKLIMSKKTHAAIA